MKRTFLALAIALLASLPVGWITAMLLTPILWRLEPILHVELAGHSGPSDWVIVVIWILVAALLFSTLRLIMRSADRNMSPRSTNDKRPPISPNRP